MDNRKNFDEKLTKKDNPIIWADLPDLDIIRVEDVYYMVSTTMHLFPGGVILRSYDLINWEIATYLYDVLDDTPGQRLDDGKGIYGAGMWAASLRYHQGIYYVCFVANDTRKTYLFRSEAIEGPWKKTYIEGFFHDCSLLFDDDRSFIVYGGSTIYLTELKSDFSGPLEGGLHRILTKDDPERRLGYEGAHIYKINDRYYLFLIHWPSDGTKRRTQACLSASSLEDDFIGGDVLDDDIDYFNNGVAQGGIVDTHDGKTYAMLFQDHDAVGRIPVLVPVTWENNLPVFGLNGKVPKTLKTSSTRPDYQYEPLIYSDDFDYVSSQNGNSVNNMESSSKRLHHAWQWNHQPDQSLWSVSERPGYLRLKTSDIRTNVIQAKNTLSQRTMGPCCEAEILIDGSCMQNGDYAGLVAMQSHYGCVALKKENDQMFIVMMGKGDNKEHARDIRNRIDIMPGKEHEKIEIDSSVASLRVTCDFENSKDEANFYYEKNGQWHRIGKTLNMKYTLDHFMGYRVGLFCYSTQQPGGYSDFDYYHVKIGKF